MLKQNHHLTSDPCPWHQWKGFSSNTCFSCSWVSEPWSPRIHLQGYWDGEVYITVYQSILLARRYRKRKVAGCSLKVGSFFQNLIWLRNYVINVSFMNARLVLTPSIHSSQHRLLHKVRKRLSCDSSWVTLPRPVGSLVSCSTETTEPLSPVCSCTQPRDSRSAQLASLCLCQGWAQDQRIHTHRVCLLSLPCSCLPSRASHGRDTFCSPGEFRAGRAGQAENSCSSSLGWRRDWEAVQGTNLGRYSDSARQGGL